MAKHNVYKRPDGFQELNYWLKGFSLESGVRPPQHSYRGVESLNIYLDWLDQMVAKFLSPEEIEKLKPGRRYSMNAAADPYASAGMYYARIMKRLHPLVPSPRIFMGELDRPLREEPFQKLPSVETYHVDLLYYGTAHPEAPAALRVTTPLGVSTFPGRLEALKPIREHYMEVRARATQGLPFRFLDSLFDTADLISGSYEEPLRRFERGFQRFYPQAPQPPATPDELILNGVQELSLRLDYPDVVHPDHKPTAAFYLSSPPPRERAVEGAYLSGLTAFVSGMAVSPLLASGSLLALGSGISVTAVSSLGAGLLTYRRKTRRVEVKSSLQDWVLQRLTQEERYQLQKEKLFADPEALTRFYHQVIQRKVVLALEEKLRAETEALLNPPVAELLVPTPTAEELAVAELEAAIRAPLPELPLEEEQEVVTVPAPTTSILSSLGENYEVDTLEAVQAMLTDLQKRMNS